MKSALVSLVFNHDKPEQQTSLGHEIAKRQKHSTCLEKLEEDWRLDHIEICLWLGPCGGATTTFRITLARSLL